MARNSDCAHVVRMNCEISDSVIDVLGEISDCLTALGASVARDDDPTRRVRHNSGITLTRKVSRRAMRTLEQYYRTLAQAGGG